MKGDQIYSQIKPKLVKFSSVDVIQLKQMETSTGYVLGYNSSKIEIENRNIRFTYSYEIE